MGFLKGVRQIGDFYEQVNQRFVPEEVRELYNLLELPLGLPDPQQPEEQRPQDIRVWLRVKDANAEILDVQGVSKLELAEYCGGGKAEEMRWKYLYREPVGSNTTWKFSPIYKLGKGVADKAIKELVGEGEWKKDKNTRFYKLYTSTLRGFEEGGCFGQGSADLIMAQLEQRAKELADLWSDKKRSYLLIFGVEGPNGKFLFPGELRALRMYFRKKLKDSEAAKSRPKTVDFALERQCAVCHAQAGEQLYTVKDVYAFGTFDKKNFLPAGNSDFIDKVFPLCSRCYTLISGGATEVDGKSVIKLGGGMSGVKIWVVPEVIGRPAYEQLIRDGRSYLGEGVEKEERYLDVLARRDASFVYHFLFVESNQAQLILHRLVEDVPPSHFRKLQKLWREVKTRFYFNNTDDEEGGAQKNNSLDNAVRTTAALLMSLAGKTDGEKSLMKENVLTVLACLFQNQPIDVRFYKSLAVSRLAGLFSDEDWIQPKKKEGFSSASQLHSLWMLFEFFTMFNQTIDKEGDDL